MSLQGWTMSYRHGHVVNDIVQVVNDVVHVDLDVTTGSYQFLIASVGGPGDLDGSGGRFSCGRNSGLATTATTEKATPRAI